MSTVEQTISIQFRSEDSYYTHNLSHMEGSSCTFPFSKPILLKHHQGYHCISGETYVFRVRVEVPPPRFKARISRRCILKPVSEEKIIEKECLSQIGVPLKPGILVKLRDNIYIGLDENEVMCLYKVKKLCPIVLTKS